MEKAVSLRPHIGIYGRTNAGKSTLMNLITGQATSLISPYPGTTTDAVRKPMEIHGLGPVVFIDSPGFGDGTSLGDKREKISLLTMDEAKMAIYLVEDIKLDRPFIEILKSKLSLILYIVKRKEDYELIKGGLREGEGLLLKKENEGEFKGEILNSLISLWKKGEEFKEDYSYDLLIENVKKDDLILLIMPQDKGAPEGRLIMPQVETIRKVLDLHGICICLQEEELDKALALLNKIPDLVITDSSCFKMVYNKLPKGTRLTSFSIIMAAIKGDLAYYIKSVRALESLEKGRILIAESCTHPPLDEDIGTVKIPSLIKKRYGDKFTFSFIRGKDPIGPNIDLIIHCGACMFTKEFMNSRVNYAKANKIPLSNYGVTLAYLSGILDNMDEKGIIVVK